MFPKTYRFDLRQEKEFFSTAKRKNFPLFQVLYQPSDHVRFSVIVPKKVSKSSAKRHKVLRQMRHILMQKKEQFANKQLVVVMFYSSLGKTYSELEQAVETASGQIR